MASDTTVGVSPPVSPSVLIDNSAETNDSGQAVVRQRVEDPVLISLVDSLRALVTNLSMAMDPVTGRMRVLVDPVGGAQTLGTVTTVGTVSTVSSISGGTISTVSNVGQEGGYNAQHVVPATMQFPINQLRDGIVIA